MSFLVHEAIALFGTTFVAVFDSTHSSVIQVPITVILCVMLLLLHLAEMSTLPLLVHHVGMQIYG